MSWNYKSFQTRPHSLPGLIANDIFSLIISIAFSSFSFLDSFYATANALPQHKLTQSLSVLCCAGKIVVI